MKGKKDSPKILRKSNECTSPKQSLQKSIRLEKGQEKIRLYSTELRKIAIIN